MGANAALLVIDMQEDLCRDGRRRHLVDAMIPRLTALIDRCLYGTIPVVFTQYWLSADDAQFKRFGDKYCIEETAGAAIISELHGYLDRVTVIRKSKHSAFFGTDLEEMLRRYGTEELAIVGLQTHICIMTTAADASYRGFAPVVLEDCVVSSTATKKTDALDWIRTYVGRVEISAEFLRRSVGQA